MNGLTQRILLRHAAHRLTTCRPDLAARFDLDTFDGLLSAQHEVTADPGLAPVAVVAVLRRFSLTSLVAESSAFAHGLTPQDAQAWRRSFTRTVFLAGNPDNLSGRFSFAHVAVDGSAGWTAPAPDLATAGLRRLLRTFEAPGALPATPHRVVQVAGAPAGHGPRPPARFGLYVATAVVPVTNALVNVHHLIAEAVVDHLLRPGDAIEVHTVPRLAGLGGPEVAVRVGVDPREPTRLRACAALTMRS
jgi:hypothetical protein